MKKKKMRLASYLIANNYMTADQARLVLVEQEKQSGSFKERFGRIAVKKGFITEARLNGAVLSWEREQAGL
jgi:hypothetical protein